MTGAGPFDGHSLALAIAETIAFLLELALLAGVAVLGWQLTSRVARPPTTAWLHWVVAIAAPIAVAVVWGLFLAPKAVVTVPSALALGLQALLFVGTAIGLFLVGLRVPAAVGLGLWMLDLAAVTLLRR